MLGGRDPVGVDRLDVVGVGLAAPADQEALGDRRRLVDLALRDRRPAGAARGLGDEARAPSPRRARGRRAPARRRCRSAGRKPHSGASIASAAWTSTRGSPERTSSGCGSAGGRPGSKRAVDEQPPDLARTAPRRRAPRCRRRGSAARRPPCRARRSRWRRRRRPRGRTGPRSRRLQRREPSAMIAVASAACDPAPGGLAATLAAVDSACPEDAVTTP